MTGEKLQTAGSIQFIAKNPFPYGTEFAFLRQLSERATVWMVSIITAPRRVEEVKIEGGELEGRRFVVMDRCESRGNGFMCAALPVEKIDERSNEIEVQLLKNLLNHECDDSGG